MPEAIQDQYDAREKMLEIQGAGHLTTRELAAAFQVSTATLNNIIHGKTTKLKEDTRGKLNRRYRALEKKYGLTEQDGGD